MGGCLFAVSKAKGRIALSVNASCGSFLGACLGSGPVVLCSDHFGCNHAVYTQNVFELNKSDYCHDVHPDSQRVHAAAVVMQCFTW